MAHVDLVLADGDLRTLERVAAIEGASVQALLERAVHRFLASHRPLDPDWHSRFEQIVNEIRGGVPANIPPGEIEADVTAVRDEVRRERRARGH